MENNKTLGEKRIRVDFNPSQEGDVSTIKQETAKIINVLEDLRKDKRYQNNPEAMRLISEAQTNYEAACMWAVKAVTSYLK